MMLEKYIFFPRNASGFSQKLERFRDCATPQQSTIGWMAGMENFKPSKNGPFIIIMGGMLKIFRST